MRAKYCKCKNKYTINDCDRNCNAMYYWAEGIGSLTGRSISKEVTIFDSTFDETFN